MESSFDATAFTKNRRRLLRHKVGRTLCEEVAREADRRGLMSDERFSVDGTLIEEVASMKSFRRRDDDDNSRGDGVRPSGDVEAGSSQKIRMRPSSASTPSSRLPPQAPVEALKVATEGNFRKTRPTPPAIHLRCSLNRPSGA